nr:isocitrate dehydrogenase [NAD] subunit gamma, mitochondrial-like [Onthophagus taurus]
MLRSSKIIYSNSHFKKKINFTPLSSQRNYHNHQPPLGNEEIPHKPYGGRHIVTMLPGGGIGPELMNYVEDVVKFVNAPIDFEKCEIKDGPTLDEDLRNAIISIKRNGVGIKGTIEPNLNSLNFKNSNVEIRNKLDLFVNLTVCKSYPGITAKYKNVDVVVVRQNTEGEYAMLEHECRKGVIESLKIITQKNTMRVAKFAFDFATRFRRRKITVVHKANIMKLSDGLFLKTVKEVSKSYPHIKCNDIIVDATTMKIVSNPYDFDMLIMPNLYGTIINNVICGITGGAGLTSGSNYGSKYAIFEPACRTLGKTLQNKNIANPVAMLNATVSLLYHLKRDIYARIISEAIYKTICIDNQRTMDIGGDLHTSDMIDYLKENISLLYCEKYAGYQK